MPNTASPAAHPGNAQHSSFTWDEVNCFLRPQAVLCDQVWAGYGELLLCLTSLHRTWGPHGFFREPGLGHFAFLARVEELTGLRFDITHIDERNRVAEVLRDEVLPRGGPAIAPANIREFPHNRAERRGDLRHFFLVRGYDPATRSLDVLDYLHVGADNKSLEYSPCPLPVDLFSSMVGHYWERFVGTPPPELEGDARYWVMQIRVGEGREPLPAPERCRLVLHSCSRVLGLAARAREEVHTFDDWYLSMLRSAHAAGDAVELERVAYRHYCAANHARVYARVLCGALNRLGRSDAASRVAGELASWDRDAAQTRMQLLLKCKLRPSLDPVVWRDASAKLSAISERVGAVALAAVEESRWG